MRWLELTKVQPKTPCCGYDTMRASRPEVWWKRWLLALFGPIPDSDVPRPKAVIMWNPYNAAVQCHNCVAAFYMQPVDATEEKDGNDDGDDD